MGQRIIGLTGGIATGKSTVSRYLMATYDLPVLDADDFARAAVAVNSPILQAIVQRYGPTVLHSDGSLNRPALGQIIFHNATEKAWVESQIHPFVRDRFITEMQRLAAVSIVIQAIPLLFEANLTAQVTEIWVVACTPEHQLARLMTRDALTEAEAMARIQSQLPLADKVQRADFVLWNDDSLEHLYAQVDQALASGGR